MAAQRRDQVGAVGQVPLLGVEDRGEAAPLPGERRTPHAAGIEAGGIADDVDQAVEGVQAPEQVVVLAISAREESGEMAEADTAQARRTAEPPETVGVLRAQAIDQDAVELARALAAHHGKGEHVPKGETQVADDDLAALLWMPMLRGAPRQQSVDVAGARFEVDDTRQMIHQRVEFTPVALGETPGETATFLEAGRRRRGGAKQTLDQIAAPGIVERR